MKQNYFITDIDGTLLRTGQPPHPRVVQAIARFQEDGGLVCLCTGRALPALGLVLRQLPPLGPGILCGGALIYDFRQREILESREMDERIFPALEQILSCLPQVSVTVSTADAIYRIRDNECLLTRGVYEDRTAPSRQLDQVGFGLLKVLFTCDRPEVLEEMGRTFLDPDKFELHRASRHFYELTAAGVNKGTAVAALQAHLGCGKVFCAGDAPSDLDMAPWAELFYAPQTAMESVKQAADRIFPPPEQGGLAWALDDARAWAAKKEMSV